MPRIISFAWTTPALLAGAKTVTRRQWDPGYARQFQAGDEVLAYDRSPRAGGKPVARLRLTTAPMWEPDAEAPDSDWTAEGFEWFCDREWQRAFRDGTDGIDSPGGPIADRVCWIGFEDWREAGGSSWVIRFEIVEILSKREAA